MSKAKNLGAGASFAQARPISARRAAIGAVTVAPTAGVPDPTELPLDAISQNPDNPRNELRDLEGLADSIREIGLVNAITVATRDAYLAERPDRADDLDDGARYIVVDGHRRLAAARLAGATTIRVSVDNALVSTDEALLEAAFVANVHRDDMNPLEQAHALQQLVKFYGSQNKAAKRLGIGQSTISSKLSILELTPELQADLIAGRRTIEQVRNLSKLSAEEQRHKADQRAAAAKKKTPPPTDLSRRDNSEPPQPNSKGGVITTTQAGDLSRRDRSAQADPGDQPHENLPEQRTEPPHSDTSPMGQRDSGSAAMDLAYTQLDPAQRSSFIQRYFQITSGVEEVATHLGHGLLPADRAELAAVLRQVADLLAHEA
ncbi:ParB/RepB/Spo0J family partition protein [Streptomyces roseolilacinus]|uniref:Plasmid partitioning protein n=1 Tax=Streptomyces roseolilacinus TaxID=66904 RepID=A0A918B8B2_9ACTN|nr:ParB/RepB/Spo0J family partition protein [Streptomyces roseolilacinus]GGQ33743.1 plasmid partitioning protein [Streptomyces roseolilacinus]